MVKDVAQATQAWDSDDLTLHGQFAVSNTGSLAYVAGPGSSFPARQLVAVDRAGHVRGLGAIERGYRPHPAVSPDGSQLLVTVQDTSSVKLYRFDLARRSLSPIGEGVRGEVLAAAWGSDNQIAASVIDAGAVNAVIVRPDPASLAQVIPQSTGYWAGSLSQDGRLASMGYGGLQVFDVRAGRRLPAAAEVRPNGERQPAWSPDGRWLAYTAPTRGSSNQMDYAIPADDRAHIYVRAFPGPGDAVAVSTAGGHSPVWNRNGRELFFLEPGPNGDTMMSVDVTNPSKPSVPRPLFATPAGMFGGTSILAPYDVSPDGRWFYTIRTLPSNAAPVRDIQLVINWISALPARVRVP